MIKPLFFIFLLIHCTLSQGGKDSKRWRTLNGAEPLVIARGGYSGLLPESSQIAFGFAKSVSLPNVVLFCDLQLTKDGHGICLSSLELQNSTNIASVFPNEPKSYNVNGQNVGGWFALDYTYDQLYQNVSLMQNIYSRPNVFDAQLPIFNVENAGQLGSQFWLNVQYALFYSQHKLDPALYVQEALEVTGINFISSPDISFLKTLNGKVNNTRTKLVFRFLEKDTIEPTTNLTYGSILENLSTVKPFAQGILVPKEYIWPVSSDLYLEAAATTLVTDAHQQGLGIYASGFANDYPASYNYSYDPTAEYLQFIDNSQFSVDGLLTDFPSTASESIACLAHNKNATRPAKGPLIISHNGASGVYAGCTDLAYEQAINDGADIIDCSVQMSKDGVAFCLASPDLSGTTTAVPNFLSRSATIPEIQNQNGIFSFDLTWKEIQTLKPQLTGPYLKDGFKRNPAYKNKGEFMTLTAFLELAQTKAVTGILINIQNAAYLASNKSFSVTDVVSVALRNAAFDKQHTQKVLIQSDDSQVLSKFKDSPGYQKVLLVDETISAAPSTTMDEIRKYADAAAVRRSSIVKSSNFFSEAFTSVVRNMHTANVSVYAFVFRNEFISLQFDFLSDPMVELATYIVDSGVDGVFTEFPATASAYLRSQCSHLGDNDTSSYTILQAKPGSLLANVPHHDDDDAPTFATAPAPILSVADVVDPPLPSASNNASSSSAFTPGPAAENSHSRGVKSVADDWVFLCLHFCCLVYFLWDHESDHYF